MEHKKSSFGLCSSLIANGATLNFESTALLEEAGKRFAEVISIHPGRVRMSYLRDRQAPRVFCDEHDISGLSCLVVRGTGGHENAIAVLARSLRLCGCHVLDPIDRFSGKAASKLLSTIDRFEAGIGSDSHFAFSLPQATVLIGELFGGGTSSLLCKPVAGKQGQGVRVLSTQVEAMVHAREFFSDPRNEDTPLFLQPHVQFVTEYRVMAVGDKCLGMVEKHKGAGRVTANVATGGTFVACHEPAVMRFIEEHVTLEGILGIDVARDAEGRLHVIESNRAPLWEEFERATGINIAREIVDYAYNR